MHTPLEDWLLEQNIQALVVNEVLCKKSFKLGNIEDYRYKHTHQLYTIVSFKENVYAVHIDKIMHQIRNGLTTLTEPETAFLSEFRTKLEDI